ncbi:hypothetical protein Tsubulata_034789 [Turnera subulata]|uniref:Trichome birefringence-like N-terminal domain-containing protein n=1 Tax=Turnera subulata TaxID=218843 RepID=A0A9Q0G1F2_9ROSI|nr:hypothetical protein Tsubulata_034789 [Turnera subulata]
MADAATKHLSYHGGSIITDLKSLSSLLKSRRIVNFAYGFMFAFVLFTVFLAFSPSPNSSSPWFTNIFSTSAATVSSAGSQFSSIFSYFSPNSSSSNHSAGNPSPLQQQQHQQQQQQQPNGPSLLPAQTNTTTTNRSNSTTFSQSSNTSSASKNPPTAAQNLTQSTGIVVNPPPVLPQNQPKTNFTTSQDTDNKSNKDQTVLKRNQTTTAAPSTPPPATNQGAIANPPANHTTITPASGNQTSVANSPANSESGNQGVKSVPVKSVPTNYTASLAKKQSNVTKQSSGTNLGLTKKQGLEDLVQDLLNCDLFDGDWVKDESYPLYKPGSCSPIDEQFNCIINGRPDKEFQKYKWRPRACTLPRLNPAHMLELLRGKRLAFVGDSLNRNMWESLICMLKAAVKDKKNVYEANGRHHFKGEASYSFVFKDYGCTVEFYASPFLVQEWEFHEKNGSTKETLRLDLVGRSSSDYKDADFIIFNTGHWWTHDKTSKGKDYYQEGSHVYDELNVLEAFRKALTTWARWVDANVKPTKSLVFFRGYSHSHFSGGQWNSGGACDSEVEPIKNATYLREYPPKMVVLERVLRGMKTHVTYLNVTQMTDYRKDGHPSIYRKPNVTEEERRSPMQYQDCSHWCLPGVPDAWNEILYAELLIHEKQKQQVQKRHR